VGLGLAIAQRAIELHAGRVWAENAEPGLRVCVNLPAADATLDSAAESARHSRG